jgi:hypothetical protein
VLPINKFGIRTNINTLKADFYLIYIYIYIYIYTRIYIYLVSTQSVSIRNMIRLILFKEVIGNLFIVTITPNRVLKLYSRWYV